MHFRILKMIATSGFLTALECIKFVFSRGSAPYPVRGAYTTPSNPLAGLRAPTSKGREGRRKGKGQMKGGRRKSREGSTCCT